MALSLPLEIRLWIYAWIYAETLNGGTTWPNSMRKIASMKGINLPQKK